MSLPLPVKNERNCHTTCEHQVELYTPKKDLKHRALTRCRNPYTILPRSLAHMAKTKRCKVTCAACDRIRSRGLSPCPRCGEPPATSRSQRMLPASLAAPGSSLTLHEGRLVSYMQRGSSHWALYVYLPNMWSTGDQSRMEDASTCVSVVDLLLVFDATS